MGGSVFKLAAGFHLEKKKESALYWCFDQLHVASWTYPDEIIMRCESVQARCDKAVQTVCWPIWRGPNRMYIKDTGLASIHTEKNQNNYVGTGWFEEKTISIFFTDLVFKNAVDW